MIRHGARLLLVLLLAITASAPASADTFINRQRTFDGVIGQWPWALNPDGTWTRRRPTAADVAVADGVGRTLADKLYETLNVRDYDAKGDGIADDTAAINAALAAAYASRKELFFPCGAYLVSDVGHPGYAILNPGVSMISPSKLCAGIYPATGMASTSALIYLHPPAGAGIDFLRIENMFVCPKGPSNSGTARGGIGFLANFDNASLNLSRLSFKRNYFCAGNDYSALFVNDTTKNAQGVPSNSDIEENSFFSGIKFTGVGDNVNVAKNVVRSPAASTRPCVNVNVTTAAGTAGNFTVEKNNLDCDGGAIFATNGRNIRILNNNIEQSTGKGTGGGSVVDLDGSYGTIVWADISNNAIGILPGADPLLSSAVRVNAALGTRVDHNTILGGRAPPVAYGILVNSAAFTTWLSRNEVSLTGFANPVGDAGLSTAGVNNFLVLVNSFTNFGSNNVNAGWIKDMAGNVFLSGRIKAPSGFATAPTFAALPAGHRPLGTIVCPVVGNSGASPVAASIQIDATGPITLLGPSSLTEVTLTGCTFPTLSYVNGDQ